MIPFKMNQKVLFRAALVALAIFTLTFTTTTANAACGERGHHSALLPGHLLVQPSSVPNNSIAGLWQVSYTTSDNEPFQDSFDMWHNDGTELESANVNPIPGNFCLGTWRQVGSEIHLHHVGWAFDNLGNLVGPFTLDSVITLGVHGSTYSGKFDFNQYDTDGNLLGEVTGTLSATRISVN